MSTPTNEPRMTTILSISSGSTEQRKNGEGQTGTPRRRERGSESPMYRRGNLGARSPAVEGVEGGLVGKSGS
ncbi:hypothetical protein B0T18DRAFT_404272 [Schizothecium vesticola]|uniref:Uncharacterized protein n=1 Tax=Schizothecium vesticola TaxID=314040 RepID=A0AA40F7F5_9PEZI|nr:hypothetical protein B0T18DRAFT_404272 [Schizothecium vesticola]